MGLNSICDDDGNYLLKKVRGFRARSTGCSCCSRELLTEKDVRKEATDSLMWVLRAAWFFGWDFNTLVSDARKLWRTKSAHQQKPAEPKKGDEKK